MPFNLEQLLRARHGENFALHAKYLNPQLTKVVKTLGFDSFYERGEGCYLYDDAGQRYLDLLSGFGVFALGRAHPVVKDALAQALGADLPSMVQMDCALLPGLLAEQLVTRSPSQIERVVFGNSGAEAVEAAFKFARAATGRERVCYHAHAYHGLTMGALSLNGSPEFKKGFGAMVPGTTEIPFGDLEALQRELRAGDVAAFIVEPIQGKGVYMLDRERWLAMEAAVHEAGALLICDEVQTGLGRTGRFYAFEHYGLTPDIITVSKALSGGYVPVGAMLASDKIVRSVYRSMDQAMVHSTTFKGNQLAMVAGLATLSVFDDEHVIEHAAAMGGVWKSRLADLAARHEFIADVRGEGQMIAVEFGRPASAAARRRWRLAEMARPAMFTQSLVVPLYQRHRILTQVAADNINVIKLLPALIAGDAEVDLFVDALDQLLTDAERGRGWLVDFGLTMARGAMKKARTSTGATPARS
ncbi:MAG TPA: aspartate aminotransferase family protein [Acidimicrobiales bacterium]|nr:aspartate aminotransferase family protein [Acidimicrobiales bacterium]